ncbi:MAG TPA: cytochrome-c oxidase, cbb3-type subunit III [Rubrivivax sp.]|mgnify:FL=1|nr:cytochrome-c oxidase, cbb3-type subunit III [Rubrivivax sp.]
MSDFTHVGWSVFVAATTVIGLLWCLWLLFVASQRTKMADDNTTGHVWDVDLRELNNPLPRWWLWLFVITVVFAGIYLALYPGLGKFPGALGWSSVGQYKTEQQRAQERIAQIFAQFNGKSAEELAKDSVAMGIGERLFGNNCAQCHGSDARGGKGFPDLTQPVASRLATESAEQVVDVITNGRTGVMPPMAEAVGTPQDVRNVAHYVLSLSGSAHNSAYAQLGKPKFAVCAACHGADGKGMKALGAPNLTDKVWLHGWGEAAIVSMINNGKTNIMPAFGERLSAEQIHVLAAYVWSLSQAAAVAAK